jgi:membrane protease subunit HflK
MMRWLRYCLILVLAGYLLTGVRQISPGGRAVVTRFGEVISIPGPGLWIGLPYGIDRVQRVSVDSVRRVQVGFRPQFDDEDQASPPGQLLTGDHNLVNVQVAVDYTVKEDRVYDYVMYQERAEGIIGRLAEAVLSEWIAGHKIDEVLISAKAELPPFLVRRLQSRIEPYFLGVEIQGASVGYLHPPQEVQSAFDEVTEAQASIRTREHDARQRAEREVLQAKAEANRIEKLALAYAQGELSLARGEAEAFGRRLEQYWKLGKQNPGYLNAIWWQEMDKLFAKLKESGRIDLLDHHLNRDGLDITTWTGSSEKKK